MKAGAYYRVVGGLFLIMSAVVGCGETRVLVMTGTTVGLDASPGDGNTQPPSVTFGYKRAEVAFVPTGKDTGAKTAPGASADGSTDAYSTLAAFRLAANWFSATKIEQFIATGHAARVIQQAPNEFTRALLADSAGTDELSTKFTKLMAEEKNGACWQALHAWRDAKAKGISDFEFARLAPHQDLRAEAWRDAVVQEGCRGK